MASLQYRLFSGVISLLPLKLRLQVLYFRRFKKLANLSAPATFNEKIQYKKIYDRSNLLPVLADKIASKEYVSNLCKEIYIPKTLWEANTHHELNNIDFNRLPSNYVFKANHTSQTIEIIKGAQHLPLKKMKSLAKSWLMHDQAKSLGEWAYQNIPRRIFIEEYLDFDGKEPDDYKFFVYHGKVHFIQVDYDRFTNHKRNMFDRNWKSLGFDFSYKSIFPPPIKPEFLDKMIEISECLGANLDFIRVDLYFYKDKITFGELTVYPGAGFEKFPTVQHDLDFGKPWKLGVKTPK